MIDGFEKLQEQIYLRLLDVFLAKYSTNEEVLNMIKEEVAYQKIKGNSSWAQKLEKSLAFGKRRRLRQTAGD